MDFKPETISAIMRLSMKSSKLYLFLMIKLIPGRLDQKMAEATKLQVAKVVELFTEEMLLQADKEATSKVRESANIN